MARSNIKFIHPVLLIFFILSGCASKPFENWKRADTARQVAYSIAHSIDWMQTRKISNSGTKAIKWGNDDVDLSEGESEKFNFILGDHPSTSEVDIWMGSTLVLQIVAAGLLDEKYRSWYQMFWIGAETGTVYHNYQIGLGFGF